MSYTEYKKYETVGEWWNNAGSGKFPIQVPAAIQRIQKEKGISFHEAFELLVGGGSIILVKDRLRKLGREV